MYFICGEIVPRGVRGEGGDLYHTHLGTRWPERDNDNWKGD